MQLGRVEDVRLVFVTLKLKKEKGAKWGAGDPEGEERVRVMSGLSMSNRRHNRGLGREGGGPGGQVWA